MLNQQLIREKAQLLSELLKKYAAKDENAAVLERALQTCLGDALTGRILQPLSRRDVPGARMFDETTLGGYSDLANAYADFQFVVTGDAQNPAALRIIGRLRERMNQKELNS
jgi:hypothetical protein